jgi:hypothetical protein
MVQSSCENNLDKLNAYINTTFIKNNYINNQKKPTETKSKIWYFKISKEIKNTNIVKCKIQNNMIATDFNNETPPIINNNVDNYALLNWENMKKYGTCTQQKKFAQIRDKFFLRFQQDVYKTKYIFIDFINSGSKSATSDLDIILTPKNNLSITLNQLNQFRIEIIEEYSKYFQKIKMEKMFDANIYAQPFYYIDFLQTRLNECVNYVNISISIDKAEAEVQIPKSIIYIDSMNEIFKIKQYAFSLFRCFKSNPALSNLILNIELREKINTEYNKILEEIEKNIKSNEDHYSSYLTNYINNLNCTIGLNIQERSIKAIENLCMCTFYVDEAYHSQGAVLDVNVPITIINTIDELKLDECIADKYIVEWTDKFYDSLPNFYLICSIFDNLGFIYELKNGYIDINKLIIKISKYMVRIYDAIYKLYIKNADYPIDIIITKRDIYNKINEFRKLGNEKQIIKLINSSILLSDNTIDKELTLLKQEIYNIVSIIEPEKESLNESPNSSRSPSSINLRSPSTRSPSTRSPSTRSPSLFRSCTLGVGPRRRRSNDGSSSFNSPTCSRSCSKYNMTNFIPIPSKNSLPVNANNTSCKGGKVNNSLKRKLLHLKSIKE